jgi:Spy/CpxP family protein refolding chaperone
MNTKHSFFGSRIAVALTAFALAAGIPALAQQSTTTSDSTQSAPATKADKKAWKKEHKERKEKMAKELGLTADQKKQMKALQQDQRKQMEAIRNDSSLSQEQKQAKFKEVHKSGMEKRDALLTPEQRDKMQHLRAEHEAEEAKEGKDGKQGGHHWRHKKDQQQTTPPATTETPKS